MRSKFTVANAKTKKSCSVFFSIALLAAGACALASLQTAFSQSGRGQPPDSKQRKTVKRKYPGPRPTIRLPEQKGGAGEDDDTIRINSDLVNVVVTVGANGRGALGVSLDLKPEDFEILEDGATQEIANFSRVADQP